MTAVSHATPNSQNLLLQSIENESLTPLFQGAEKANSTAIELVSTSNEPKSESAQPNTTVLDLQNVEDTFAKVFIQDTEDCAKKGDFEYFEKDIWSHDHNKVYDQSDSVAAAYNDKQTRRNEIARAKKSDKRCMAIAIITVVAVAATFITLRVTGYI